MNNVDLSNSIAKNPNDDEAIVKEAKARFRYCEEWESYARRLFELDYKFANGDSDNLYQWPNNVVQSRLLENRPILTINKTAQHNLQIINDAKQNKPGIRMRPVGDEASYEAAQVFQEMIYHIEYISGAENVYDSATTFQVEAGIGYWRVDVEFMPGKTFDQEIYIRRIKDPRQVYLDPDINEVDGSDSRFGFIFEDLPKDKFNSEYPKWAGKIGWGNSFNQNADMWLTQSHIRVCEYFRRGQKNEKLVTFIDPTNGGEQVLEFLSKLDDRQKEVYKQIKDLIKTDANAAEELEFRERDYLTSDIQWFKIAGDKVIEKGPWLGQYIPIVRLPGTETVIDGILDRKGHTRALKDAQRMYNYNTSANIEFGALQSKAPWVAPVQAIEGFEEYYRTANTHNHSYLPYNGLDEDGNTIAAPSRPAPPQASPAYVQAMQIAQNEMMMVSGQYQAQMGENENAKSGVAINARQRQGDRATYHFIDNQAIAIRYTGTIIKDLIPKIYDTQRVIRIAARDGKQMSVTIDPKAQEAFKKVDNPNGPVTDNGEKIAEIIFNPNVGNYDIQSDTGPSFATRRQEAFNALTQIAAQNKDFMNVGGDLLFKVADFPEADILAQRWRKVIPPQVLDDDAPNPQMVEMNAKIEQLTQVVMKQAEMIADKSKELEIREYEAETARKTAIANASRLDYEAESKRLTALGNSGPAIAVEQIQPLVKQIVEQMLRAGAPGPQDDDTNLDDIEVVEMTPEQIEAANAATGSGPQPEANEPELENEQA